LSAAIAVASGKDAIPQASSTDGDPEIRWRMIFPFASVRVGVSHSKGRGVGGFIPLDRTGSLCLPENRASRRRVWPLFPRQVEVVATQRPAIGILDTKMPDATPRLNAARVFESFVPGAAPIDKHERSLPIKHPEAHRSPRCGEGIMRGMAKPLH
jgi:hypothetical protein